MDKTKQDKFREELSDKYLFLAFEAFGLYDYYGAQYQAIDKQITEWEARQKEAKEKATALEEKKDKTPVEKQLAKDFRKDIVSYAERIKSVTDLRKKLFEKATAYQQEGGIALEKSELFTKFTLKTPEQIAADKEKQVAVNPKDLK